MLSDLESFLSILPPFVRSSTTSFRLENAGGERLGARPLFGISREVSAFEGGSAARSVIVSYKCS